MDYYSTLGVPKTASDKELKSAYKKLSMQHHPDRTGGDDSKFKEINEAYSTLKDPQKRQAYDNPQPQGFAQGFGANGFEGMNTNFEDLFSNFGFNMQGRQQQRNPDITIAARITLEEAYTGKQMIASYRLRTGKEEVVEIKIPAGAHSGNTIRYQGFGEGGMAGPRGNLNVRIEVVPHSFFAVDGVNLHCKTNTNVFDFIIVPFQTYSYIITFRCVPLYIKMIFSNIAIASFKRKLLTSIVFYTPQSILFRILEKCFIRKLFKC